ncbi:uncharacterized protein NFIA_006050 [Aspergillus fischeri NRRL 181]|uniref:Uncharacterized protein n=1 Tax=Neosartorya fischeri (strain ATCC 1020 / DSM 3700 / CBS 544.65 / FGSC A1164 / JCM 1740 / NRRL 181 / WB 181) TaxID=331117 RepID=A1DKK2_NEOFI|nr:uncharacterized protein NFIA_006050 [Aspergillus fischeri NRRL 181]EAW17241.1 hypothetical protein NFIA_006050 [Aspergillus fischeri NRRL 181]
MDQMLTLRTPDGIVMTYFDATRPRTDPMVCVNILRLFYHYSRGMDPSLRATKDWVHQVLLNFAYIHGTRYYTSPDVFLYYVSKLVQENPGSDICRAIVPLLTSRLRARVNADGDSIALAMRIIACQALGIPDELDLQKLLSLQSEDGGWEVGWLCCTGKRGIRIGNRGVATALAIHAIESMTSLTNIGLQMGVGTFWRNSV